MFHSKRSKLVAGVIFDLIGMSSLLGFGILEFADLAWAPIAGYLMTKLYPGKSGVAAGIFTTVEELLPGLDVIPSFTIMWCYTYLIKSEKESNKNNKSIDVDHSS
ncbi:hypothetical protein F0365_12465 [Nonlabens sp. Ci31]|jgi:hypothetical protein|uniref:hypothetical protein n=1 Tax=Nonlabens sp. Ci31 TaxID=2608253 RepID=UPI00146411E6|nr:hypothetical protein [Nonlabens sp. Ci31]QJP35143.1 hypothetical protein F0365_12465 [Nonlabens sp. Ci31]